ncbi:MAG: STAS domain-containing protein [Phycisphaeraceae bacterium]|nr:STAS domain-containing protein [Phycisphaeraceae bacterium]
MPTDAKPVKPDLFETPTAIREVYQGVLVVSPKGPSLSESDASALLAEVVAQVPSARGRLLLDMTKVEYMTSSGISMLVQLREACVCEGGTLALCGLAAPIADVLKTTRVDRLFTVTRDRAKALRKLAA